MVMTKGSGGIARAERRVGEQMCIQMVEDKACPEKILARTLFLLTAKGGGDTSDL